MKSSIKQLESRGFFSDEVLIKNNNISDDDLLKFLNSSIPCERTLDAKIAIYRKSEKLLPSLCELIINEKKLYTIY